MNKQSGSRRALIIGGGIAGSAAAVALQRAGLEPVVFEAHSVGAAGVGAFLTLAPNGVRALRTLGLDDVALAQGIANPTFVMELGDGREIGRFATTDDGTGAMTTTVRRADLYAALRDAVRARGIAMVFGRRLLDAQRRADGTVIARFDDGSEEEGALLIGADGLHSRVRTLLNPRVPAPRYVGLLNTGGFAHGLEAPGDVGTMHFVFGRKCFFGWVKHPDGGVWWFANPARPTPPSRDELSRTTSAQWRDELHALFEPDAPFARQVIDATDGILAGWSTYDLPRVPVWHRDAMLIIGDAAHAASPTSGQGASMALEDALELGRCLRDVGDVDAAFGAFESLRRARVERVVREGRRAGSGKTPGPFGRAVRDVMLRAFFGHLTRRNRDPGGWAHGHRIEWDARVSSGD